MRPPSSSVYFLDNIKSQADAAELARRRAIDLAEHVENTIDLLFGHAGPAIGNLELDLAPG